MEENNKKRGLISRLFDDWPRWKAVTSLVLILVLICSTILTGLLVHFLGFGGRDRYAMHFNFVVANATVPVNQAALHLWDHPDTLQGRTYLWYGRRDTFDRTDLIGERFNLIGGAGRDLMRGLPDRQMNIAADRMASIYRRNNDHTFTVYVVDTGLTFLLRGIFRNRIPMENINIVLLESGAGSASGILSALNRQDWEDHMAPYTARLQTLINNATNNRRIGNFNYPGHGYSQDYPLKVAFAMMFDNVSWWLQSPNAIVTANYITEAMYNQLGILNRVEDPNAAGTFLNQTPAHLMQLANALIERNGQGGFADAMFGDSVYNALNPEDGRPVLIFMGTSPLAASEDAFAPGTTTGLEVVLNRVIELYGNTHNIVFKGHPAWPVLDGWRDSVNWFSNSATSQADFNRRVAFLNGLTNRNDINFSIIPCQIPADMILLFFDTPLDLGGFDSSLYQVAGTGSPHRVLFFTTQNFAGTPPLGAVTLSMYQTGEFDRNGFPPIFITPDNIATIVRPPHH